MIFQIPRRCRIGLLLVLPLSSCSLVSETGPLKGTIKTDGQEYRLVEVKSMADLPGPGKVYGRNEKPPENRGRRYTDRIRSRDVLNFVITDTNEQSPFYSKGDPYKHGPVEIPEDGRVDVPYIGGIQVMNRSLAEVSSELGEKVKPVSNTARVSVTRSSRLPANANVIGDVKKPGPILLDRSGINSLDLLAASGGPTESEYLFTYTLRRQGRDYSFDYLGFRRNPFLVEEGDLLTVALDNSNRFHVMGAINRPLTVPFPVPSPSLADALGAATGLDERRSDPSGIFVFRRGDPATVYTFNLKDPHVLGLSQRFPIHGEDIVYVTEAPLTRWNRMLTQILPISISQGANAAYRYVQ